MSTANGSREARTREPKANINLNPLMLVEVSLSESRQEYRFLRASEVTKLNQPYRILYKKDAASGSLVHSDTSKGNTNLPTIDLPTTGTNEFLKGIETALNRIQLPKTRKAKTSRSRAAKSATLNKERVRAISSKAMDAATDCFFEQMDNMIDRWTYDASSKMLSDLALQAPDDLIVRRREAAEIQVKSKKLNTEFRAFVIENLVCFKLSDHQARTDIPPALEIVSSDNWQSHQIEQVLFREYEGQTKVEFSQLHCRLCAILDRKLKPEENILGPKAIASNLSQSLNACAFTTKQLAALEPIIISGFNASLENLYHQINKIWIGMDILPEGKLEILNTDVA